MNVLVKLAKGQIWQTKEIKHATIGFHTNNRVTKTSVRTDDTNLSHPDVSAGWLLVNCFCFVVCCLSCFFIRSTWFSFSNSMFLRIVFPYQLCMMNVCKHGPKSLIALLSWPNPKENIFPRHSYTEKFPKPNGKCVKHGLICIQVAINAKSSWRSFTGMLSIATGCPIRAATNQLIH